MKKVAFILLVTFATTLFSMSYKKETKIDDWDYNSTVVEKFNRSNNLMVQNSVFASTKSLGFSVGGAKDANNFYENIKNNYLPKLSSITYEGVFYDHYFEIPKQECKELFCPSYDLMTKKNIFTDELEYFLSVGLNSNIKKSDFKRKRLNLVIVLDISSSMEASFDEYYYDNGKKIQLSNEELKKTKMQIATKSIASMIDHLKSDDRFGMVLFNNRSYKAKPLRDIKTTNIKAIKKHILDLKPKGGTNWSAGYKEAIELFKDIKKDSNVENRIIFLTDAMPNRGELTQKGLFGIVDSASKNGIYTTFIGVGVDFNSDLVEKISKTKGANYYSIHSAKEFKKRLDDEFDFMVTPLVFDLNLKIDSKNFKIEAIYGSPEANISSGEIMRVNTLFPSASSDEKIKGGIVLLKLKKIADTNDIKLQISYKDRKFNSFSSFKTVSFGKNEQNSTGIKKAILLAEYVTLMKNWLIDMRKDCNDQVKNSIPIEILKTKCMIYPPKNPNFNHISKWEKRSCNLKVSDGYKKIFSIFSRYFKNQMDLLHDNSLTKEYNLIKTLIQINDPKAKEM